MKAAAKIQDADIRKLLSERDGKEYLEGGRLLSNTAAEGEYALKLADISSYHNPAGFARGSGASDVLGSKTKSKNEHYQKARDYAGTGLKGGLTGLGILGASNAMRGRFGAPSGYHATRKAMHSARKAFGVGAGVAVADRAYRHEDVPKLKQAFAVSPNPSSSFRSPAESLANSSMTGSFKPGVIHDTGKAPKSLTLGKKFHLP